MEYKRTWGDTGGECQPVSAEVWNTQTVRLVAAVRHADGYQENAGVLFIDHNPDAVMIVARTIKGECPPGILADWIEDHPEWWRAPGPVRDAAVREIVTRLRRAGP